MFEFAFTICKLQQTMLDKQNKLYFQHSLPYCQLETAQLGGFYYKTAAKLHNNDQLLDMRIGLKVGEFGRAQEDHISYLIQLVNSRTSKYRLVVIGLHFLFLQRAGCIFEREQEQNEWFITKQRQIFQKLSINTKLLTKILNQDLSGTSLLCNAFKQSELRQKIEAVIQELQKEGN